MRRIGPLALALSLLFLFTGTAPPAEATHVDTSDVIYVLPPDGIPAIMDPRFSTDDWLTAEYGDQEKVLAVVINGDVRAYPIRILNWHEIVNDVVGGIPIAATYCPLCGTGLTFDRRLPDGTVLTFKVSGRLYKNDLVMYDVESGPNSWWPQVLGEAISGPLHGTKLRLLSSTTVPWGGLKATYPDAKLLARPVDGNGFWVRSYNANPYAGYESGTHTLFPKGHIDTESGLHPKEFVLSLTVDGVTKVYPYRFLAEERVVNDVVAGTPVVVTFALDNAQAFFRGERTFTFNPSTERMVDVSGGRWNMLTGEGSGDTLQSIPGVNGFWFAIFDFTVERVGYVDVYRIGRVGTTANPTTPSGGALLWVFGVLVAGVVVGVAGGTTIYLRWRADQRRRKPLKE